MPYSYVWEYRVRKGHTYTFERAYGPDGEWVQLFRRAPGYRRTELLRDRAEPLRYVTVDFWDSADAWGRFRREFASAFEEIDARCEEFTESEREIGRFDRFPADAPDG